MEKSLWWQRIDASKLQDDWKINIDATGWGEVEIAIIGRRRIVISTRHSRDGVWITSGG